MSKKKKDSKDLSKLLKGLPKLLPREVGVKWSHTMAERMKENYVERLQTQGRAGDSQSDPLSGATYKIYSQIGNPDGSGIINHLSIIPLKNKNTMGHAMVIASGKPTMIAVVQNNGVTIGVTEKMRGFLAHQGIYLKQSTIAINIPGRRSFEIALEKTQRESPLILRKLMQKWWQDNVRDKKLRG